MPRIFASIRTRLNCLVLLAILPGLGLTLFAYMQELQLRKAHVREQALLLTRVVTSHQEQLITDARQLLTVLAQLPQVRSSNPSACNSLLGSLIKQYPLYASLGVIKPNGEIFCSSFPSNANFADRQWLQATIRLRQFMVSDYQIGRITNKPVIVFAYPVIRNTQVQSVVFAALDLAWLNQLIAKVKLSPSASLIIVDANGTILAHYPNSEKWVGRTFPNLPAVETILAQGRGSAEVDDIDGVPRMYAFTLLNDSLPTANVYMGIGLSEAAPFAAAEQNLRQNLVALLVVTTLAIALLWLGSDRFILHWLQRFTHVINRLAAGDLGARVGFDNVPCEMRQLADTFDRMATSLTNQINRSQLVELDLKKANERFQLATDAVNAIIYDWDIRDQKIVRTQGLFDVLGYRTTEAEPTDDWWYERIHPDDRKLTRNQIAAALKNTHVDFSLEYRVRNKEEQYIYVWEKGIIVRDAQGNAQRVVGSILNITERKHAEAEIRQLNATLEQQVQQRTAQLAATNQELESFSYSVSHDLRTPLRHVMGFAEALAQRLEHTNPTDDSKVQRYVTVIQNSSQRMMILIDELLTLSRVGRKQLLRQPVELNSLVENAIALVSNQNDYAQQSLEFRVGELPTVMGDSTLLQQVFVNLIDNALKFSQYSEPSVIQIDALPDQTIFIKDNGVGFDMTYADQLFGAFQRLHSQREFKGTGIGLAIVQRIIHRHNGKIWVESSPQQGATFYFQLG